MDNSPSTFRKCTCCSQELAMSYFYEREKAKRWDAVCKECRKGERRSRYLDIVKMKKDGASRPKRIIEPKEETGINFRPDLKKREKLTAEMDFTDLEKHYDLQLSNVETSDLIQGFNEFISILREEFGKQLGCKVYVTKD